MRFHSLLKIISLLASIHASSADDATTISSIGCVAPSAFESCLSDAETAETQCAFETAGNTVASGGCSIGLLINQMQCYLESCWNKIYSCEYQNIVVQYQDDRGLTVPEDVPFWPAPDDAPGGCTCNLGDIYVNITGTASNSISSCTSTDTTEVEECSCCSYSAELAAFYGICPTTDPDQLGLGSVLNAMTTFESTMGASCSSIISSIDCAAKWGVYSPYKGQYPDPAVGLPPNGTELLSTTSGPLTSPPGGATYTWSLLGSVMTATAAPYNEKNVEATSSEGVTATSTKSGGTAATSMASGTATTTLGSTKSSSTKATSTAGSNGSSTVGSSESSTSSAAATSASKTSRAAKVQSIASLDYAIFALLTIAAYIS